MAPNPFPKTSVQIVFSANFFALVAAVALNWRVSDLATLYWLELVALAGVTLWQMRRAGATGTFAKSRGYLVILFLTHYGTFCVMYRAALIALFGAEAGSADWFWLLVWLPIAALITSHGLSLRRDYLPYEAAATSPFDAMWIPYLRELPVHVPLLIAVAVLQPDLTARGPLLVFGVAKMLLDVGAHILYHTRIAKSAA